MNALRSSLTATALAVVALTCTSVFAGTIWDGGGTNDYWTTGANWDGLKAKQFAPLNNGTADIHMAGTTRRTPMLNVPYSIKSLTFDNGAAAFVILGAQELTIGAGGVRNNDADIQTVIGPIRLAANQTWTAAAGRLQMDTVNLNGFNLTFGGASRTDMIGVIHGVGDLILPHHYASTVTMVGMNNSYVGATKVQSGTLVLQGNGVAVPGDLTISSGTVRLDGNEKISQNVGNEVTVLAGGLLDVNTRTETLAKLSVTGGEVKIGTGGKLSVSETVVTGAESKLTNAYGSKFYVGEIGNGTLDIMDRGQVTGGLAYVGFGSDSIGVVNVDGVDSIWEASSTIGYYGSGTVNITGGGTVNGGGYLGYGAGSTGIVNVDGVGSSWSGPGVVGYQGAGFVNVTNGGFVYSGQTIIGGSAEGNVNVDGPGSYWYSNYDIQVYKGDLAVTDQAVVVSAMPMLVNSLGTLSGNGTIGSDVMSRGLVAPGPATGALSIDGYYTQQPTGVLEIELGGVDDDEYDQLLCNPNTYIASLDGTLEVKLIDGFTPLVGQTFTILTSYDVDGEFANLLLPSLPGRRFDVIYNPQSVVLEVNLDFGAGFANANDGDGDGDVGGRDFLLWQRNSAVGDLSDWQANYGVGALTAASAAVPEPGGLLLASSFFFLIAVGRGNNGCLI
jgi:T5SS/PEP-CTERM-associated repeat protein